MAWWGWMIIGAFLLGSELLVIDAGFYLVFIGIAAAITGLVELTGIGLEPWLQWILFSVIAVVFMVVFRKKFYDKMHGPGEGYENGMAGEIVSLEQSLQPGEKGRLGFRGTDWTVINESDRKLEEGERVRIYRVDGLTLKLTGIETQD